MRIIKVVLILIFFLINHAFAKININTASAKELSSLSGIGPIKALSIVNYRKEHGVFKSLKDLMSVEGIGLLTFKKIRSNIKLTGISDLSTLKHSRDNSIGKKDKR